MGELSSYDNHPADEGTDLYEREKDIALNEHSEIRLKNIKQSVRSDGKWNLWKMRGLWARNFLRTSRSHYLIPPFVRNTVKTSLFPMTDLLRKKC